MSDPRELAATVRPVLSAAFRDRQAEREALAALDALVAECERLRMVADESWTQDVYDAACSRADEAEEELQTRMTLYEQLVREHALLREQMEEMRRERDEMQRAGNEAIAWARRFEEALRRIEEGRLLPVSDPLLAYAGCCEIARAALTEERNTTRRRTDRL